MQRRNGSALPGEGNVAPRPPRPRPKLSGAQHKQKELARARADAHAARFHLVGMTNAGVIIMG